MKDKRPVLYICPHCRLGFRDPVHGFQHAVDHISERHTRISGPKTDWWDKGKMSTDEINAVS